MQQLRAQEQSISARGFPKTPTQPTKGIERQKLKRTSIGSINFDDGDDDDNGDDDDDDDDLPMLKITLCY